jgi:hypothetical protein
MLEELSQHFTLLSALPSRKPETQKKPKELFTRPQTVPYRKNPKGVVPKLAPIDPIPPPTPTTVRRRTLYTAPKHSITISERKEERIQYIGRVVANDPVIMKIKKVYL